jgi:hypothetical protein
VVECTSGSREKVPRKGKAVIRDDDDNDNNRYPKGGIRKYQNIVN